LTKLLAAFVCAAGANMPQATIEQRIAAVNAYSRAFRRWGAAAEILMQEDPYFREKGKTATIAFTKYQVHKIEKCNNPANQYSKRPPSNPKKVPDSVVRQCAAILKQGYQKSVTLTFGKRKRGVRQEEVRQYTEYYSNIKAACVHQPQLAQVCLQYNVSAAHLLRRMHQVDKQLVARRRDWKRALSQQQRDERMKAARSNLQRLAAEGLTFLQRVAWIDEFSIWMVPKDPHQKVYCDAHDEGVHMVVPMQSVTKGDKVKLHIVLAVNFQLGAFYMEYTTGTTEINKAIRRLHIQHKEPYKVGGSSNVQPPELRITVQLSLIASLNQSIQGACRCVPGSLNRSSRKPGDSSRKGPARRPPSPATSCSCTSSSWLSKSVYRTRTTFPPACQAVRLKSRSCFTGPFGCRAFDMPCVCALPSTCTTTLFSHMKKSTLPCGNHLGWYCQVVLASSCACCSALLISSSVATVEGCTQ
jgi:hypothetical protein